MFEPSLRVLCLRAYHSSTTMDPGPFFYIDITTYYKHCSLSFSANKHHFPHYTSNTFRSDFFLLLVRLNLGFIPRENYCCATLNLHFGVSQRIANNLFSGAVAGDILRPRNSSILVSLSGIKRISARGVSHIQSLYLVFVLLSLFYFVLFASLYQKHKKISSYYSCYFCYPVFILLK